MAYKEYKPNRENQGVIERKMMDVVNSIDTDETPLIYSSCKDKLTPSEWLSETKLEVSDVYQPTRQRNVVSPG